MPRIFSFMSKSKIQAPLISAFAPALLLSRGPGQRPLFSRDFWRIRMELPMRRRAGSPLTLRLLGIPSAVASTIALAYLLRVVGLGLGAQMDVSLPTLVRRTGTIGF